MTKSHFELENTARNHFKKLKTFYYPYTSHST